MSAAYRLLVLVPGFNESPADFETLVNGRNGISGLNEYGFTCVRFPQYADGLRVRIDRFTDFLDRLRERGYPFPVIAIGYSLGGLVLRGFLRAHPHRAHEFSHVITIATPHWGVETFATPHFVRALRIPDQAMDDMHLGSDFMRWLNGTGGHWDPPNVLFHHDWVLDREPWVAPEGTKLLSIAGLMPSRGGDNDGLVYGDSATLGSRIPAHFVVGPHCNHLNLIGHFTAFLAMSKGFLVNDHVWPHTVRAIARFTQAQPRGVSKS